MTGTVYETGGGVYRVRLDDETYVEASLRGRLKLERRTGDKVVVGDRVRLARQADIWTVDEVEERVTEMVRRGAGGRRAKVIAANLDRVFVVIAARDPDPTLALIDRLLAVVESSRLHAVLVVNKVDLPGAPERVTELTATYAPVGYEIFTVSARSGDGLEALRERAAQGISAFIGPSGAGKSSLLNALDPTLALSIGDVSLRTGRGRHTTVGSRLIPLASGGVIADTPGFGDVGLWGIAPNEVEACFPEIEPVAASCRFRGCAHLAEPDCAVRDAVERGEIARSRFASYVRLRQEAVDA